MPNCWRVSLGERGCRVVLFERKPGGVLYREVWIGGKRVAAKKSLGHRDRERAKADAYKLLATLKTHQDALSGGRLTLRTLFDIYVGSPSFQGKKPRTQREDRRKLERVLGFVNPDRDVMSLTVTDVERYKGARLRGECGGTKVGMRAVEADLSVLRAMLNWGIRQRTSRGMPLLPYNPLQGVKLPREKNPQRPIATWERFEKTREVLETLQREAASEAKRRSWIKVELALVLAEATGRRIGAIQQLRWEDVDFDKGVIRWRQDADKQGIERWMPMPSQLVEELRSFQRRLVVVGGPVFASPWRTNGTMHPRTLAQLLVEAEQKAGLPKLTGGVWHPYRRKWATERKHLPVIDVAQAGGWSDTQTLLTCYQQPDHETLLAVISETRKVRERGVG